MVVTASCTMLVVVAALMVTVADAFHRNVTASDQLRNYAFKTQGQTFILTTSSGAPVPVEDAEAINQPRLILDYFFMESITHMTRERIPARVVHTKATGAFGFFEVTHSLADICKAQVFSQVGKQTPLVGRLSSTVLEKGASDVSRDNRGFAMRFYTEEGNWDLVTLATEQFLIKDPIYFPSFVHAFHRNPKTELIDDNMIWDFITLRPESIAHFLHIFSDIGIPDGYRFLAVYGIHTFQLTNYAGAKSYVRFHVLPDAGIRNLTPAEAATITDPDYATRDLYNAIENGNYPVWTLYVQVISEFGIQNAPFDIFDVTIRWPKRIYPLRQVGKIYLNRNPENQFADIEQLAFCPGNLVPGIQGVDKIFEARVLAYRDAHNYRLGVNKNKIKVNCPFRTVPHTYTRDGYAPVKDNEGEAPNYFPNSYNGPVPYREQNYSPPINVFTDPRATNFADARDIYLEKSAAERCRIVQNIVSSLRGADGFLQERAVNLFRNIDVGLATRIQDHLLRRDTDELDCVHLETTHKIFM